MMKKSNIAIAALMLCAIFTNNASAQTNIHRHHVIADNCINANIEYTSTNLTEDIAVVTQHKEILEKELAEYKKSWMPTFLKIAGAQLGIDAGAQIAAVVFGMICPSQYLSIHMPIWQMIKYLHKLNIPTAYIRSAIFMFIHKDLNELARVGSITDLTKFLTLMSTLTAIILLEVKAAKYLFNKANSYGTEIERLEKEIAHDTAIIEKLQKLQA